MPIIKTQVVFLPQTDRSKSTQPYEISYFLPRKISGKAATFLQGAGYTTNLLSQRLFDTLGVQEQVSLESYVGAHGTLEDESCISFLYSIITLPECIRDQAIHNAFIVSHLKEDTILGMPFLKKH